MECPWQKQSTLSTRQKSVESAPPTQETPKREALRLGNPSAACRLALRSEGPALSPPSFRDSALTSAWRGKISTRNCWNPEHQMQATKSHFLQNGKLKRRERKSLVLGHRPSHQEGGTRLLTQCSRAAESSPQNWARDHDRVTVLALQVTLKII